MDLDSIYSVAAAINKLADDGLIRYEDIDKAMAIHISVSPLRHFGIDKELYRQSKGEVDSDFIHNKGPIEATIDGVRFVIEQSDS